jgi:ribosomal protein L7Ae-like RNA K-turn-binding protein
MNDRVLSLLGIARRAGRVCFGSDAVTEALRKGEAKLVLFARDLSPRTAGGVETAARARDVPCVKIAAPMDEIGIATGKRAGVVAVNDAGFAKAVAGLIGTEGQTNGREC